MRAILEFNLPEEKEAFEGAQKAFDFWDCLFEFAEKLRKKRKYALTEEEADRAVQMEKDLWEILEGHNVTLGEYS